MNVDIFTVLSGGKATNVTILKPVSPLPSIEKKELETGASKIIKTFGFLKGGRK